MGGLAARSCAGSGCPEELLEGQGSEQQHVTGQGDCGVGNAGPVEVLLMLCRRRLVVLHPRAPVALRLVANMLSDAG